MKLVFEERTVLPIKLPLMIWTARFLRLLGIRVDYIELSGKEARTYVAKYNSPVDWDREFRHGIRLKTKDI